MGNGIPPDALTVAFVDPTGVDASLEMLRPLTTGRKVNLLILFPDYMDIIRNVEKTYSVQPDSNLDHVLGPDSGWRERWSSLPDQSAEKVSKLFLEIYKKQLRTHLGYSVFADEVLRFRKNAPLYRILFASKNDLGLKFWQESTKKERGSNRLF